MLPAAFHNFIGWLDKLPAAFDNFVGWLEKLPAAFGKFIGWVEESPTVGKFIGRLALACMGTIPIYIMACLACRCLCPCLRSRRSSQGRHKMSVFVFKDGDPASACSICLEEFKGGDRYRVLPACSHSFHVACLDQWLTSSLTCPNCRNVVVEMVAMSNVENV